mmetsp:Transcript_24838/g.71245  ORF Transcript_24838/g.71245 Transcript_24838/m.71245 type:complete len:231 (+) Transcript_24838:241-933(+)
MRRLPPGELRRKRPVERILLVECLVRSDLSWLGLLSAPRPDRHLQQPAAALGAAVRQVRLRRWQRLPVAHCRWQLREGRHYCGGGLRVLCAPALHLARVRAGDLHRADDLGPGHTGDRQLLRVRVQAERRGLGHLGRQLRCGGRPDAGRRILRAPRARQHGACLHAGEHLEVFRGAKVPCERDAIELGGDVLPRERAVLSAGEWLAGPPSVGLLRPGAAIEQPLRQARHR